MRPSASRAARGPQNCGKMLSGMTTMRSSGNWAAARFRAAMGAMAAMVVPSSVRQRHGGGIGFGEELGQGGAAGGEGQQQFLAAGVGVQLGEGQQVGDEGQAGRFGGAVAVLHEEERGGEEGSGGEEVGRRGGMGHGGSPVLRSV